MLLKCEVATEALKLDRWLYTCEEYQHACTGYDVDPSPYHVPADSAWTVSGPDPDVHVKVCSVPFWRTRTWTRLHVRYAHFVLARTVLPFHTPHTREGTIVVLVTIIAERLSTRQLHVICNVRMDCVCIFVYTCIYIYIYNIYICVRHA